MQIYPETIKKAASIFLNSYSLFENALREFRKKTITNGFEIVNYDSIVKANDQKQKSLCLPSTGCWECPFEGRVVNCWFAAKKIT